MKKFPSGIIPILVVLACVVVTLCQQFYSYGYTAGSKAAFSSGYSEGYEEGRSDGYSESLAEDYLRNEYFMEGYQEGLFQCQVKLDSAVMYASENSELHPEEAYWTIYSYTSGEPIDGEIPTRQEYSQAVHCLLMFFEYFYEKKF